MSLAFAPSPAFCGNLAFYNGVTGGGGGSRDYRIGWTAKDWKERFDRLSPEVKTAIKSVARPNTTKDNREQELRQELAYIDAKFMRLYVQLMEKLHTEQLEQRQQLRDEQARLLSETIKRINDDDDDDMAIIMLLL
jgi:hypothetical protein